MKERIVKYFCSSNGKAPVKDWLNKLKDLKAKAKIDIRIRRDLGNHRSVGDSVIELKIPYGPGYRVYLSIVDGDQVILLLIAGDKSSQERDIKKAKENLNEWRQR